MNYMLTTFSVFLTITVSSVYAQLLSEWGVKGGVTISNQNWNYSLPELNRDMDDYIGLNLDVFGTISTMNFLSVQGELSYVQKGTTEEIRPAFVDENGGYIELDPIRFKNRFDYVSLSLYAKIKRNFWRFNPYIFIGPRIDFLVEESLETIAKPSHGFEKLNLGFSLGLGSEIETFLPFRTLIGFQYSPDLSDLYENEYLSIRKYSYEIELGVIF